MTSSLVEVGGCPGWMLRDIALRPGVAVDLFVDVHGDVDAGAVELAVHGGVHTAATWQPYAQALGRTRCFLAVDLPGRGGSSMPRGLRFGALDLDDYVTALVRVLERLEALGRAPATLLGHSMGGTLLAMLQQRLVAEGTSLARRFGVREVVLVAPDLPAEAPWALGDSGELSRMIESFAVDVPEQGKLFEIPATSWPDFFFTGRDGERVAGAPTAAEIAAAGYCTRESLLAIHQLNGTGGFATRPSVSAGLFRDDARLRVVAYAHDPFVLPDETRALYRHLTGDDSLCCFVLVEGKDAMHDMQISNPARLAAVIDRLSDCDRDPPGRGRAA
jgi:pimeloyl-ACP methyl ester carboxylesterase